MEAIRAIETGVLSQDLHQLRWLKDEEIGNVPKGWNHLVGNCPNTGRLHQIHYTDGGPWFEEYRNCDYANEWRQVYSEMRRCKKCS